MADDGINFDYILEKINPLGRFQILVLLSLFYNGIVIGLVTLQAVYISYSPDHRCNAGPLDNETLYPDLSENEILNLTTPWRGGKYSVCYRYNYNLSECNGSLDCVNKSAGAIPCDNGYHYDRSHFTETTVTQFNLVCDRHIMFEIEASLYMIAFLIGGLLLGPLADKIGRKNLILVTGIATSVCNGLIIVSHSFTIFGVCRFIYSFGSTGSYMISVVYLLELVGVEWRGLCSTLLLLAFPVGYILWSPIAYIWRDWHQMQMATFVITLPFVLFSILLPESPRWLFASDKEVEGKKVTKLIARINGTSGHVNKSLWSDARAQAKQIEKTEADEIKLSYFTIFKAKRMRIVASILFYINGVHSFVYYGMSFGAGNLPGNLFINNIYGGLLEISACILGVLALKYFGRVTMVIFCLIVTGIFLLISVVLMQFVNNSGALVACSIFAYVGKAVLSASYCALYAYRAEVFPTHVRGSGSGFMTIGAGLASSLYPFILALYQVNNWIPGVVFGLMSIAGGLLAYRLPETHNEPLLNTVEEAEEFYKRS